MPMFALAKTRSGALAENQKKKTIMTGSDSSRYVSNDYKFY